jgi:hypothetical protein
VRPRSKPRVDLLNPNTCATIVHAIRLSLFTAYAASASVALCSPTANGPGAGGGAAAAAWQHHAARSHALLVSLNQSQPAALPVAPAGVADIHFSELFGPIGDRGLEYSAKLRALDGLPVRIAGYMIREQERSPGVFLLAGWPVTVETKTACGTDNPPPSAVHVILPAGGSRPVAYRPGRLLLLGRIELGPRVEADGRNSAVRLVLDAACAVPFASGAEPDAR